VIVQVAVASAVVFGMGALAVDIGALYTAQAELQVSVDAAALAAAAELVGAGDVQQAVIDSANAYAAKNKVMGMTPVVESGDVEFGRAVLNPSTDRFEFQPSADSWDAIRVTLNKEQPDGEPVRPLSVPLAFAQIFNVSDHALQAQASAVLVPRDISVVIDLSNSMCYDSTSKYWNRTDGGCSNLRDIWCALDGPEPSKPYIPASAETVDQTEYEFDSGPSYGFLNDWGSPLKPADPGKYNVASDPGMFHVRRYQVTSNATLDGLLRAKGYNEAELAILKSAAGDADDWHWRRRCGVLLGLADWSSGVWDGEVPPAFGGGTGGDGFLADGEVSWVAKPDFAVNWNWNHYIDWVQGSGFQYYYGLKSFTDFMMQSRPRYYQTDVLWSTPQQPLRAVKDAVRVMTDVIDDLGGLDRIALEIYDASGRHEVDLTDNLWDPSNLLYQRQTGHYDVYTNIGGGLYEALCELTWSPQARNASAKVVVLMSDGCPNRWDNRTALAKIDELDPPGDSPEYWDSAYSYALAMARVAAKNRMRVYTVSVGYGADQNLMAQIAAAARGEHFFAQGNPQDYTAQLRDIFEKLGGKRPVSLIE
jgi:Flp pilus assembly protein TadG